MAEHTIDINCTIDKSIQVKITAATREDAEAIASMMDNDGKYDEKWSNASERNHDTYILDAQGNETYPNTDGFEWSEDGESVVRI